jgi:hypothetical protein
MGNIIGLVLSISALLLTALWFVALVILIGLVQEAVGWVEQKIYRRKQIEESEE